MNTCIICLELNKKTQSFPCCNNHFLICDKCLQNTALSKNCPHCRQEFTISYTTRTVTRKICNWEQLLGWTLYTLIIATIVCNFIVIISRYQECYNQPCTSTT